MIWWFLILGVSVLVVVCVAIALFIHLRRSLEKARSSQEESLTEVEQDSGRVEH